MPKLHRVVTVEAPVDKVFEYVDMPEHLPEIWPSLFKVEDVKILPDGGHHWEWHYNFGGRMIEGETETRERILEERIVDAIKGDLEGTFTWTFHGENGKTRVVFEADYELPMGMLGEKDKQFVIKRNELEADVILGNLKARLEV